MKFSLNENKIISVGNCGGCIHDQIHPSGKFSDCDEGHDQETIWLNGSRCNDYRDDDDEYREWYFDKEMDKD